MINFCAVLLLLCKPFFANHPSGEKLALINGGYPKSPLCRLDLKNETCFAEGIINSKEINLTVLESLVIVLFGVCICS